MRICGDVLICCTENRLYGLNIYDLTAGPRWEHPYDGTSTIALTPDGAASVVHNNGLIFFMGDSLNFKSRESSQNQLMTDALIGGGLKGSGANATGVGDEKKSDSRSALGLNGAHGGLVGSGGVKRERQLIVLAMGTGEVQNNWNGLGKAIADDIKSTDTKTEHTTVRSLQIESNTLMVYDTIGNIYGYGLQLGETTAKHSWHINVEQKDETPGPIALGDEAAFFVINDVLTAVNVGSGQVRWRFAPKDSSGQNPISLSQNTAPFVGNGMAIAVGSKGIFALDIVTGKELWRQTAQKEETWNTPVVSWDGNCLFATTADSGQAYGYKLDGSGPF